MKTCEMVVDWKMAPGTDGGLGDEIVCGKPATYLVEGSPACDDCAAECLKEGLNVERLSRAAEREVKP